MKAAGGHSTRRDWASPVSHHPCPKYLRRSYHRSIRQNKPVRQLRRFSRESHGEHTAPIMTHDDSPPASTILAINPIHRPHSDNKLSQTLQHIGRSVLRQTLAPAITGQIDRNDRRCVLDTFRAQNMPPYRPAIGESMDEYNKWLIRAGIGAWFRV